MPSAALRHGNGTRNLDIVQTYYAGCMRRFWALLVSLLLGCGIVFATAPLSHADGQSWRFRNWDYQITLDKDGNAHIVLNFDFDFGREKGHGPYLVFQNRYSVEDQPDYWWQLDFSIQSVTSSTNAPTEYSLEEKDSSLGVKIGDKDIYVRGVQHYEVHYVVHGLINPRVESSGLDEFNYLAIGGDGNMPYDQVSLQITGPTTPSRYQCNTTRSIHCETELTGDTVSMVAKDLTKRDKLQAVVGYPSGTFNTTKPLVKKNWFETRLNDPAFATDPLGILGGILGVGAIGLALRRHWRYGFSEVFVGVTPGLVPTGPGPHRVKKLLGKMPYAVQFSPPRGCDAGEIGIIIDGKADDRDVTAMTISLAVKGYMKIHRMDEDTWAFEATPESNRHREPLSPAEQTLFDELFRSDDVVTTEDLRDPAYARLLSSTRSQMESSVSLAGWFKRDHLSRRNDKVLAIVILAICVFLALIALGRAFGWLGLGLFIAALINLILAAKTPARTALGNAIYSQSLGFKEFLTTADAEQLRFEEQSDIFSKYLPYAIVFGCADRWAKLFEELAAQGRYQADLEWLPGYNHLYHHPFLFSRITNDLATSYSQAFDTALAGANASAMLSQVSSSDSGFSGGGFSGSYSGGGFGGTSGGGW